MQMFKINVNNFQMRFKREKSIVSKVGLVDSKALESSYLASLRIAKAEKPHSLDGELMSHHFGEYKIL